MSWYDDGGWSLEFLREFNRLYGVIMGKSMGLAVGTVE